MRYVPRMMERQIAQAAGSYAVVVLTGPRRAGKTSLLRKLRPRATYVLLEDPDVIQRARSDPRGLLDALPEPVILDEIQHVPELLAYVRSRVDEHPRRVGRWFLTGSQEAALMHGVSESLAGRAGVLQLLPLSVEEYAKVDPFRGGFPEVHARPRAAGIWFSSYLQTYLERDVRSITAVRDLPLFRSLLSLLASRHGQILNKSDLAAPLGVSVPTIASWLHVMEMTFQIAVVPPYFSSFGRRLTKSPKLYFMDSGVVCFLLGLDSRAAMERSPFHGPIFEGFVAAEIIKKQLNAGRRRELYFFRDQQGLEVDFTMPQGGGALDLIEMKASRTVTPRMAEPLRRLASTIEQGRSRQFVIHQASTRPAGTSALTPGARAMTIEQYLKEL